MDEHKIPREIRRLREIAPRLDWGEEALRPTPAPKPERRQQATPVSTVAFLSWCEATGINQGDAINLVLWRQVEYWSDTNTASKTEKAAVRLFVSRQFSRLCGLPPVSLSGADFRNALIVWLDWLDREPSSDNFDCAQLQRQIAQGRAITASMSEGEPASHG